MMRGPTGEDLTVLFGRDKSVLSKHLRNVSSSMDLGRTAVVAKNALTESSGKPCGFSQLFPKWELLQKMQQFGGNQRTVTHERIH